MSRSWIDPFLSRPEDRPRLGAAFGRRSLELVQSRWARGHWETEWAEALPLGLELFSGAPPEDVVEALATRLRPYLEKDRRYRALRVALPGPAVRVEVFELDRVPRGEGVTREFLRRRFGAKDADGAGGTDVVGRKMGEDTGKELLLGLAVDRTWIRTLEGVFRSLGVAASGVEAAVCRLFDFHHDAFPRTGGALAVFERDYWSLAFWDGEVRLRRCRSKWWSHPPEEAVGPDPEASAQEVERTVRAYVHSGPDRSVGRIYLSAPEGWMPGLEEAFRRRTEGECAALPCAVEGAGARYPAAAAAAVAVAR